MPAGRRPRVRTPAERRARRTLLLTVGATVVLGVVLWHSPLLWPLKMLTVALHETGHAVCGWLVGDHVAHIRLRADQSGVTYVLMGPSVWKRVVVSSGGYLGATGFGAGLLILGSGRARWRPRAALALLGAGLLLIAALLLRDGFSLAFALGAAAALLALARFAGDRIARPVAVGLSTFVCLDALFDLRADVLHLPWDGPHPVTDATLLARATSVPALVWGVAWTAVALLAVGLTVRHLLRR